MKSRIPLLAVAVCAIAFTAGPAMAQPAQGLTEFRVVAVASPGFAGGQSWDTQIAPGAVITQNDHGGPWLRVVVVERGYGNGQFSTFNGAAMQLYASEPLAGFDGKVYGWYRYYYIATPFTGGRFTSSASSIAAPWGNKSTAISIR